ncbi:MAG: hypothetical protein E6G32_06125 [Actinobacteria bacterium]|nr:MAG: hypothetical protein E6G32_06125 [Actinomycetota bacterium]
MTITFAAAAAVASIAVPASGTIVPGRGMAGVSLRMSEAQVRARIGAPVRITRTRGALGSVVTRMQYRLLDVDLEKLGSRPIVVRVTTRRSGERTASGVGIGSPISAVARLPGARCWREARRRYCSVGNRDKPLSRFTLFWIGETEHVTLIFVSLVVNS